MPIQTQSNFKFSFDHLRRINGNARGDMEYANWFRAEAIKHGESATRTIHGIVNMDMDHWYPGGDPQKALKTAWATLNGLEHNLRSAVHFFQEKPQIRDALKEALVSISADRNASQRHVAAVTQLFEDEDEEEASQNRPG
jgi:hypothetical protein